MSAERLSQPSGPPESLCLGGIQSGLWVIAPGAPGVWAPPPLAVGMFSATEGSAGGAGEDFSGSGPAEPKSLVPTSVWRPVVRV